MLLTDIFAGLAVLALFLLVLHGDKVSSIERWLLFAFISLAAATHSATLGVLLGLCCAGWIVRPWLAARIPASGLVRGSLTIVAGALMLVTTNFAFSRQFVWTPGGAGVAFGRMLQDGIVARYLNDHCPTIKLKLCPYRNELPTTADAFLWGNSMFNRLGRFNGLNDEMAFIALHSLAEYPAWQAQAALAATAQQLVLVASGEGTTNWLGHTYGIIERYLPAQIGPMRAARQQHKELNFTAINRVHVPIALGSMLALLAIAGHAFWCRRLEDVTMLAATVSLALLGNAFICGVISGPHDRYGARLVWIATFAVLIAAFRHFSDDDEPQRESIPV
jgi:hypothetical protein